MTSTEQSLDILTHGVQVIPCLSPPTLTFFHNAMIKEMQSFPEYERTVAKRILSYGDEDTTSEPLGSRALSHGSSTPETVGSRVFVKGAFGAFGNPSSYHNPSVRALRLKAMIQALPVLSQMARKLSSDKYQFLLCQLPDRTCIRRKGTTPTKECWHRDQTKLRGNDVKDQILGGWINLDVPTQHESAIQYFSCIPGTHQLTSSGAGFKKLSPDEMKQYESKKQLVAIPPGHMIIFYQHITHEVLSKKAKYDSLRQFVGWCLTPFTEPPVHSKSELLEIFSKQGVPRLPSGQQAPMYSSNDSAHPRGIDLRKRRYKFVQTRPYFLVTGHFPRRVSSRKEI